MTSLPLFPWSEKDYPLKIQLVVGMQSVVHQPPKCRGKGSKTRARMILAKISTWPKLGQSRSFPGILHSKAGQGGAIFLQSFFESCWIKPRVACGYPSCLAAMHEPMWKSFQWKRMSLTHKERLQGNRWPLSTAFSPRIQAFPEIRSMHYSSLYGKKKLFCVS